MSRGKHITAEQFENMRILIGAGLDNDSIAKVVGVSSESVRRARRFDTFEKWKRRSNVYNPKKEEKQPENTIPSVEEQIEFWDEQPKAKFSVPDVIDAGISPGVIEKALPFDQFDRVEKLLIQISEDLKAIVKELL